MVEEEIGRLQALSGRWMMEGMERRELRTTAALVPGQEVADRLQRYEGSLERAFDRTLSQLERLQRLRLGQPVPPSIKVHLCR